MFYFANFENFEEKLRALDLDVDPDHGYLG